MAASRAPAGGEVRVEYEKARSQWETKERELEMLIRGRAAQGRAQVGVVAVGPERSPGAAIALERRLPAAPRVSWKLI